MLELYLINFDPALFNRQCLNDCGLILSGITSGSPAAGQLYILISTQNHIFGTRNEQIKVSGFIARACQGIERLYIFMKDDMLGLKKK